MDTSFTFTNRRSSFRSARADVTCDNHGPDITSMFVEGETRLGCAPLIRVMSASRKVERRYCSDRLISSTPFDRDSYPEGVYNLHLFCDASELAYGCFVHLVIEEETHLLYSKVKVAPLKSTSLARLEMQAAFLDSKSVESVIQQLKIRIAAVNAWTDGINVWYWLQKPSHYWKTWVANRVSFIHETSTSCNITWRHCPGSMNRADLPSRGATIQELRKVDWLHGPKWATDVNQWPPVCIGPAGDEVSESVRPAYVAVNSVLIENTWWTRMSTWTRILGTAAYMLKWKYKEQDMSTLRRMAETLLFKVIQETQFSKEIDLPRRGKPLPYSSTVCALST